MGKKQVTDGLSLGEKVLMAKAKLNKRKILNFWMEVRNRKGNIFFQDTPNPFLVFQFEWQKQKLKIKETCSSHQKGKGEDTWNKFEIDPKMQQHQTNSSIKQTPTSNKFERLGLDLIEEKGKIIGNIILPLK